MAAVLFANPGVGRSTPDVQKYPAKQRIITLIKKYEQKSLPAAPNLADD